MDEKLIEQWALAVADGDSEALRGLYDEFSANLFGYLADMTDPILAEDLLHELWLRVMNKIGTRRGPLRPWLFLVARNLAIDALRAKRPHAPLDACVETKDEHGDESVDAEDENGHLRSSIRRLSVLHRDVILLRHYMGLPLQSIAEILDVPLGTVASRLRAALGKLKKELYCESRQNI